MRKTQIGGPKYIQRLPGMARKALAPLRGEQYVQFSTSLKKAIGCIAISPTILPRSGHAPAPHRASRVKRNLRRNITMRRHLGRVEGS